MASKTEQKNVRPTSVTNGWIVSLGVFAWAAALWYVRSHKKFDAIEAAMICIVSLALVNYLPDILFLKVHKRESTGLDWATWTPSVQRTCFKFIGLLATVGFIAFLYWLFPEYNRDFFGDHREHPVFYGDYIAMLSRILPWWLGLALPYIYFVDGRQKNKEDGFYAAGMAATFRFEKVDAGLLWQHCLSWLVKGYFFALMFTYCVRDLRKFMGYDFTLLQNFRTGFDLIFDLILLLDVGLSCVGYLFSFRIFDTNVRRAEPTFMGWGVALVCYQPFWSWISGTYLDYTRDYAWGAWLDNSPMFYEIWGVTILILYAIYVWATIMFGARFSNLTHRGILTNGPYRWTKHPAYIAKNLAFWLTYIPFIPHESAADSFRRCVMLLMLNYIYYLRAKTEEQNLGTDPAYVQYSEWIDKNGIFRWLPRSSKS
jgi:protein-S-isoprenylcysteine O-methyltransferase Ste14